MSSDRSAAGRLSSALIGSFGGDIVLVNGFGVGGIIDIYIMVKFLD